LRAKRREALVRQASRLAGAAAAHLSRRRSLRLSAHRCDGEGQRRRLHLHSQGKFAHGAVRLHQGRRGLSSRRKVRKGKTTDTFRYLWFEAVPLRDGEDAMLVNWIGFEIIDAKGRVKYSMAWVTSLPVTKQNVAEIVACGRTQWKIEKEGFNVMKNHDYEFEHNFGHGRRFLAMMLASLNLLALACTP
jgi:hypothetical protein